MACRVFPPIGWRKYPGATASRGLQTTCSIARRQAKRLAEGSIVRDWIGVVLCAPNRPPGPLGRLRLTLILNTIKGAARIERAQSSFPKLLSHWSKADFGHGIGSRRQGAMDSLGA